MDDNLHDSIASQNEISGAKWVLSEIVARRYSILSVELVVSWGRKDSSKMTGCDKVFSQSDRSFGIASKLWEAPVVVGVKPFSIRVTIFSRRQLERFLEEHAKTDSVYQPLEVPEEEEEDEEEPTTIPPKTKARRKKKNPQGGRRRAPQGGTVVRKNIMKASMHRVTTCSVTMVVRLERMALLPEKAIATVLFGMNKRGYQV
jgi:hypothetical protein